jgi:hypothetical protein
MLSVAAVPDVDVVLVRREGVGCRAENGAYILKRRG